MTQPKDQLSEQLAGLPEVRASAGFTEAVLKRLDEPAESRLGATRRLAWLAAAAAALTLVTLLVRSTGTPRADRLSAEVGELRREHQLLTEELARLRARNESAAPVLFLAGSDQVDYVLDLSPFLASEPGAYAPASRPPDPRTY